MEENLRRAMLLARGDPTVFGTTGIMSGEGALTQGFVREAQMRREPCRRGHAGERKRALIVNCYFDETRLPIARTHKIPQAMAPAWLAGAFAPERWEVRVYSELYGGPLEDEALLGWPDMLVLTGLNTAFDRMLHVTAYARTRNPRVIVVAGGPLVRALPALCARFFDYCCSGDAEQLLDVVRDAFGPGFAAEHLQPRFDLVPWIGRVGYAESSRNCNFRCSFCTLTAQREPYGKYALEDIRRQIVSQGPRCIVVFLDNNFYGNDRDYFVARLELLRELTREKLLRGWAALVTSDFFLKQENLALAKAAGCEALFTGVESFDPAWLRRVKKVQNTGLQPVELIRGCLEAGIALTYGMMFDVGNRRLADLRAELELITSSAEITLPSYISVPIPMLGTPFFKDSLARGALLPNTALRDMDGTTISLQPLDALPEAARFVRELQQLRGYRGRVLSHSVRFLGRYRARLNRTQLMIALSGALLLSAPTLATAPSARGLWAVRAQRTHVAGSEAPDAVYRPAFRVDARYERHFRPTMLTDARGRIAEEVCELAQAKVKRSFG